MSDWKLKHLDNFYSIRYRAAEGLAKNHSLYFEVYIVVVESSGQVIPLDASEPSQPAFSTWEEATPEIEGSIRFDGCAHLTFTQEGYIHLCGPCEDLATIEEGIFSLGKEIPSWYWIQENE